MIRLMLRIILGMLVVLGLSAALFLAILQVSVRHRATEYIEESARGQVTLLSEWLDRAPPEAFQQEWVRLQATYGFPIRAVPLHDASLPAAARNGTQGGEPYVHVSKWGDVQGGPSVGLLQMFQHEVRFYVKLKRHPAVLVVGPFPRFAGLKPQVILGIILASLALTGVMGYLLSLPIVRRLSRLEKAAAALRQGDLSARIRDDGRDAIGDLASSFNLTADRLQQLIEGQRNLIQAVSHELRTPTNNITFALELLEQDRDPVRMRERVGFLKREASQLDELIRELLEFARFEAGCAKLQAQEIPVRTLVASVLQRVDPPCRHLHVDCGGLPDHLVVLADQRLAHRALVNLMRNACTHARSRVRVSAWEQDNGLVVAIEDDGPGVPAKDRQRVLEAFTRLDASRSRDSGGAGLGLAIVRRIVDAHGGRVTIGDSPVGGARVATWWPRARPDG